MPSATTRHIASLQHLLNEIEEEERQYQRLHNAHQSAAWLKRLNAGNPAGRTHYSSASVARSLARQYSQVNREHQVTVEACRHTSHQLQSGLFSDREVVFLIERFRSVLNRVRRDHDWLDKLAEDTANTSSRERSA